MECSPRADDGEEAQDGEGPRHRHRGRVLQERGDSKEEPRPGGDEPQVWDDPRAVVAGQHHGLRQPGHALLASLQQARPVMVTFCDARYDIAGGCGGRKL